MIKIIKKTKQGRAHNKYNIECQDKIDYSIQGNIASVVLADGAGSRRDSALLAEKITAEISKYLIKEYKCLIESNNTQKKVFEKIVNLVNTFDKKEYEIGCTLLAVVGDEDRTLIVHIGDGIIIGANDRETKLVSYPENGESLNETYLCEHDMKMVHLRITKMKSNYDTYFLMSDGVENSLWNRKTGEIAEAVSIMRKWMEQCDTDEINGLLDDAMINLFEKHSSDDLSLAVLHYME